MGNSINISWSLFKKAVRGNLEIEEQEIFNEWLRVKENRLYFEKALAFSSREGVPDPEQQYDYHRAWLEFEKHRHHRNRERFLVLARVAAILILLAAIPIFLVNRAREAGSSGADILPGRSAALLTLADGRIIRITGADTTISLEGKSSDILVYSGSITYQHDGSEGVSNKFNSLDVGRGEEFSLNLSDGTVIKVNSESNLKYPVIFNSRAREVWLSGEAYFDVAPDSARPFILHTGDINVRVLGTTFNVAAYGDEETEVLTLAEGKIEVSGIKGLPGKTFEIKPNQQFVLNKTSLSADIKTVDAGLYTAWTRGRFVFEDETLYSLFRKLQRWYDISVFFLDSEAQYERFTGQVPRFESFETILQLLNRVSNYEFELKNNIVTVK
ncbi:MAG: FecR domain-containing protein [Bacteroidales bacterium]|nr:FecR domain-containing protein [Bacteroidales bacterium]